MLALLDKYRTIQRVIITCRIRSYTGAAVMPGWPDHRLAPFNPDQVQHFVERWYTIQQVIGQIRNEQERNDQIADLQQAVRSTALAELSENPMLLTTMALIHKRRVRLPNQRVKLYQLAVENLLQHWQRRKFKVSERLDKVLDDDRRLRKIVERIAYESLRVRNLGASFGFAQDKRSERGRSAPRRSRVEEEEESGDLRRGELLELLEDPLYLPENGLPDEFLDYIDQRAGLLVGKGGSDEATPGQAADRKPLLYRFPHRTFQEYLAGCYLVSLPDVADEYWRHAAQSDGWDLAAQLGGEELYHNSSSGANTLLPVMYHLCPTKAPRSKDDWRRLLWSAQLATLFERIEIERHSRGSERGSVYLKRLIERLRSTLEGKSKLSIADCAAAGVALGRLGDPRPGVGVKHGLPDIVWSAVIEPGSFLMGSDKRKDELAYSYERPQFTCTLIKQPYRISRYPITVAQYSLFVEAKGYAKRKYWTDAGWEWRKANEISAPETYSGNFDTSNHPQVGVNWYEVVAFCRWLSEQLGYLVRLPTEAEWERAARHTDGRIYPWVGEWDQTRCNNVYLNLGSTTAVGIFPSGDALCGAADMSGNVLEWCSTKWLGNYEGYEGRVDDDLEGGAGRVWRGGSFGGIVNYVRCAYRNYDFPNDRNLNLGFRVVSPGSESLIS